MGLFEKLEKYGKSYVENERIRNQEKYRKKHERIRCPHCGETSKVKGELWMGTQLRVCKKGHAFVYSYLLQAVKQMAFNYKVKI